MKTPSSATPNDLIRSCQGMVRSIAWKIHQKLPPSVDLDDLIGFGQIGLAESARDFDAAKGTQFTTYAWYRVRGSILDGLSKMNWFTMSNYARGRYEQTSSDVLQASTEGDNASDSDWFGRTTRSLTMTYIMTHWGGEGTGPEPVDQTTPSETAEIEDLRSRIQVVVRELPEQEQKLIRGIYFDGLTIKEAGERIGISKAWASRLHARTLDALASRMSSCQDLS